MSDSILTAGFLSVSGGFQDAYTYIARGGVFANGQTGNIVLLSQQIGAGNFPSALRYMAPLLFFSLGVAAAERIRQNYRNARRLHWRQLVLAIEMVFLFLVGFLPESWNLLANSLVSFSCAMQVQAFRKVNRYAFASTMCIGNIRSGMEALCAYRQTHNRRTLHEALHYFGVILLFAFGAALGGRLALRWGLRAIWTSCALLLAGFSLMFFQEEREEHPQLLR
ncbi:MAG: YoaK family protein [Gemmiger sp.]